jgi:hypothetical protein
MSRWKYAWSKASRSAKVLVLGALIPANPLVDWFSVNQRQPLTMRQHQTFATYGVL